MNIRLNAFILVLLFFSTIESAVSQFVDVLGSQNISVTNNTSLYGSAISFADFNGDGWDDLSIGSTEQPPRFYINNAGNTFSLVNISAIPSTHDHVKMILWADYDNDGDKDLLLSIDDRNLQFYRNDGDLNLVNITSESGLDVELVNNYGAAWADINNDGLLDLYLCRYNTYEEVSYAHENRLFKQLPNGTFQDISLSAGVSDGQKASFQPLLWDYDSDGWQDIFIINDKTGQSNSMYRNLGNETFENTTVETGLNQYFNAMTVSLGDYDNDQDLDIFISNTNENYLNRNNGDGTFTNVAESAGVLGTWTCWGGVWLDYDNNGDQDLYVATGPLNSSLVPSYFFKNQGNGTFDDITEEMSLLGDINLNHAVAQADYDHDGREDFLVGTKGNKAKLYRNQSPQALLNHWASCSFEGVVSNRDAIGTLFKVYCEDDVYTRYTLCGESYISQSSFNKHVGLGNHSSIDSLYVKWPLGLEEMHYNLPVDSFLHFLEGQTIEVNYQFEDTLYICPGQSVTIDIPQDDFSTILWSNDSDGFNLEITSLGDYSATLIHESGIVIQTDTFTLAEHLPISPSISISNPVCFGDNNGVIEVINPDELISLIWINLGEGLQFNDLNAGTYYYEGSDMNGCFIAGETSLIDPIELSIVPVLSDVICFGDSSGTAVLGITPTQDFISVSWSNESESLELENLSSGIYYYTVIGTPNCEYSGFVEITQANEPTASILAMATENEDCMNNWFLSFESTALESPLELNWTLESPGEDPISIPNEMSIDCFSNGIVTLEIIDSNGCNLFLESELELIIGINEQEAATTIIYPNPGNGIFRVLSESTFQTALIYSSTGLLIESKQLEGNSLDLTFLAAGIYIIELRAEKMVRSLVTLIE